jgi:zinc protease
MEVQTVTSPGGIDAWLVEDSAVPMFALRYAFEGGSLQDPAGKEGLSNLVALLLQLGAGVQTAAAFQRRIEELAIRIWFKAGHDAIIGSIEALSEMRPAAAQLLGQILARPRFDDDAVEMARRRLLSFHGEEARTPRIVADAQWSAVAFPDHPYARQIVGSESSVSAITAEDLWIYWRLVFAKDKLKVVAVGDITRDELAALLDQAFGDLPSHAELAAVAEASPVTGGRLRVAEMDVPQSTVTFGMGAVPLESPDYIPAHVLNHIVGGNALSSRLSGELRRRHGLAYSVGTWLQRRNRVAIFMGRLATRNDMVGKSLDILREEMQKMSDGDVSQAELDDAKSYLIGSYPLQFGSNSKIAERLLNHSFNGFGPDFFENRKAMIAAVTLEQIKGVAKYMLDPENLIISIAGTPALQPARLK